jgi:hypothetical protein
MKLIMRLAVEGSHREVHRLNILQLLPILLQFSDIQCFLNVCHVHAVNFANGPLLLYIVQEMIGYALKPMVELDKDLGVILEAACDQWLVEAIDAD